MGRVRKVPSGTREASGKWDHMSVKLIESADQSSKERRSLAMFPEHGFRGVLK